MGALQSKYSCRKRRSSQVLPRRERKRKLQRSDGSSSSALREMVKDVNAFVRTSDSLTIRKQVGNYFTITSTRKRIEFAHGEKDEKYQNIKWVTVKDFQYSSLLGVGGFGAVFKARRKSTGKEYALKIQPMEVMVRSTRNVRNKLEDETLIHMERTILASCRGHPFIVKLEYAFHTDSYAILGLEYVPGGTLSSLITKAPKRRLPFHLCKIYTIELILALNYMHCKGIIYRDLKPSNVLLTLSGHLKVTDFGLSAAIVKYTKKKNHHNILSDGSKLRLDPNLVSVMAKNKHDEPTGSTDDIVSESSTQNEPGISNQESRKQQDVKWVRRRTVCGTAGYRPPEQVQERYLDYFSRIGYDERADWFSLGVCCYTMMTGRRPFPTKKELLQSDSQRELANVKDRSLRKSLAKNADAAERIMNDPEYRCLMFEVNFPAYFDNDPFAKNFVEALLVRNPDDRPRYNGIKGHPWMNGETFSASDLMKSQIPAWVIKHAFLESKNNDEFHMDSSRSYNHCDRSLTECIESLYSNCYQRHGAAYAESFSLKWSTMATARTINLFQHWNYMSDDVIALEAKAILETSEKQST